MHTGYSSKMETVSYREKKLREAKLKHIFIKGLLSHQWWWRGMQLAMWNSLFYRLWTLPREERNSPVLTICAYTIIPRIRSRFEIVSKIHPMYFCINEKRWLVAIYCQLELRSNPRKWRLFSVHTKVQDVHGKLARVSRCNFLSLSLLPPETHETRPKCTLD